MSSYKTMADNKTVLIDLKIDTNEYIKKVVEAKAKVAELKNENQALKNKIKEAAEAGEDLEALNIELAQNEASLRAVNGELSNYQKQVDNAVKANKALDGSYEQAYRNWVDADIALKNLAGTLKQNADGTFELTDEYKEAKQKTDNLKTALLEFNAGIKDGRLNVGNYAQAMEGVIGKLGGFGKALGPVGAGISELAGGFETVKNAASGLKEGFGNAVDAVKNVGTTGVNSGKLLRGAFISTGIGALVVLIGSLVAYFTKTLEGSRQIKVAFAAIGGAVNGLLKFLGGLGKTLITVFSSPIEVGKSVLNYLNNTYIKAWQGVGKVLQGVFTLDFNKVQEGVDTVGKAVTNAIAPVKAVGKGFADAGAAALKAAKDAAEIEKRTQKVNDLKRESAALDVTEKSRAENLIKLAEDKTLTEQERIQAIKDSAAIEQQIETRRLKIAEETLALKRKELEVNGANEDLLNEIAEAEKEVATVKAETAAKLADADLKAKTLELDFANQRAARAVAASQAELALLQAQGRDTIAIRKQIAAEEKDVALLAAAQSGEAKATIEKQYQAKIAAIDQEVENQREAIRRAAFDKQVEAFGETKEKEVAIAAEALRRELADFDKRIIKTDEDEKLRQAIVADGAAKLLQIEQKYNAESEAQKSARLQRELTLTTQGIDAEAALKQGALDKQLAEINTKPVQQRTAAELAIQQSAAVKSIEIEQQRLSALLAAQVAGSEARKANEKQYYDNLETETRNRLTAAGALEQAINTQLDAIRKQRTDTALQTEQETADAILATQTALNAALLQGEIARTEQTGNLIALQKQGIQENVDNLQTSLQEISALLSTDEKSRKKYANAIKALSIAEIYFNLYKEISGYWAGAGSDSSKSVLAGIPATVLAGIRTAVAVIRAGVGVATVSAQKFATGGYTVDQAMKQYRPNVVPNFNGGYVTRPTMWPGQNQFNLAGEAGAEYVSPSWQLRQAPGLFAALENWRTTGVRPFATGGLTTAAIAQPILQSVAGLEDAIARGFQKAPAPVVSVTEFNEVSNRVSVIETRASL